MADELEIGFIAREDQEDGSQVDVWGARKGAFRIMAEFDAAEGQLVEPTQMAMSLGIERDPSRDMAALSRAC